MREKVKGYLIGTAALAVTVGALLPLRSFFHTTTPIALALLLVILFTATAYGSGPAFVISVLAMLCFNFFFLPPYGTLTIADPQNWIALLAFLATAFVTGGLSAREKHRTEEAKRLYQELQQAFEKASQAEALKQSEQMKTALLDAVTHDLRTPLTSMKAAVTTLLASSTGKEDTLLLDESGRREMLEVIDVEIDRLNHLLEGLIAMARIEAGAMEPRRAWATMEEIVSIALTRSSGQTGDHRIHVEMAEGLPPVHMDEKAVAEVLHILIENAVKYSPPQTDIILSVRRSGEHLLQVSIEDHGEGIPVELREKVFEKFFRTGSARIRPAGLGMGLAIARGIVEAHGGRIWAEAGAGGRGSRFSFTIPLKKKEPAP